MDFRTTLPPFESPFRIDYQDGILAMGSCFTEHIGDRLIEYRFHARLNPFGILFNPQSILQALAYVWSDQQIQQEELFRHHDLWHHFAFHSRFSHPKKETALEQMNASVAQARTLLPRTNRLLLTWGTAFAFRHRTTGRVVANCHRLPAAAFERFRLSPGDLVPAYVHLLEDCKRVNPQLEVLISVSPVRHLRDGLVDNQRSKAVLLLAAEALCRELDFVHYFPAYELVLDDLRDYRFYERDMTHPNELAVGYVWDYFRDACFSGTAKAIWQEVEPVLRAARHRPFHRDTEAHRQFCERQLEKIRQLEEKYGFLDLSEAREVFLLRP